MPSSVACDHNAHQPPVQTGVQPRTSQSSHHVTRTQSAVNVKATPPPAIYPYTPRLALCESKIIARGDSYYSLKKSASFPNTTSQALIKGLSATPTKSSDEGCLSGFSLLATKVQIDHNHPTKRRPEPGLSRDTAPLTLPVCKYPSMKNTLKMEATGALKIDTKAKSSWTSELNKQSRASGIFNTNFSFSAPSHRHPCQHTPQISPRTSISSNTSPPTSTPDKSLKSQHVDSSEPKLNSDPHTQGSGMHVLHGYNFTHTPTGPMNLWFSEDMIRLRTVATRTEAHPAFPIDLAGASNVRKTQRERKDAESYQDYLEGEETRQNSSPDETRMLFDMEMDKHKPYVEVELLDKEARILGISS